MERPPRSTTPDAVDADARRGPAASVNTAPTATWALPQRHHRQGAPDLRR
ncbi:hypothetical protein ACFCXR_03400 [Streptomyces noursei]